MEEVYYIQISLYWMFVVVDCKVSQGFYKKVKKFHHIFFVGMCPQNNELKMLGM